MTQPATSLLMSTSVICCIAKLYVCLADVVTISQPLFPPIYMDMFSDKVIQQITCCGQLIITWTYIL